ncbi:unnamed protein product, partial [Coccothraustes coccothraustes]
PGESPRPPSPSASLQPPSHPQCPRLSRCPRAALCAPAAPGCPSATSQAVPALSLRCPCAVPSPPCCPCTSLPSTCCCSGLCPLRRACTSHSAALPPRLPVTCPHPGVTFSTPRANPAPRPGWQGPCPGSRASSCSGTLSPSRAAVPAPLRGTALSLPATCVCHPRHQVTPCTSAGCSVGLPGDSPVPACGTRGHQVTPCTSAGCSVGLPGDSPVPPATSVPPAALSDLLYQRWLLGGTARAQSCPSLPPPCAIRGHQETPCTSAGCSVGLPGDSPVAPCHLPQCVPPEQQPCPACPSLAPSGLSLHTGSAPNPPGCPKPPWLPQTPLAAPNPPGCPLATLSSRAQPALGMRSQGDPEPELPGSSRIPWPLHQAL